MKRGAHLLAPGLASVEGRFVREIMLLDGISVGGQSTRERADMEFVTGTTYMPM